jgi:hypothetical protein
LYRDIFFFLFWFGITKFHYFSIIFQCIFQKKLTYFNSKYVKGQLFLRCRHNTMPVKNFRMNNIVISRNTSKTCYFCLFSWLFHISMTFPCCPEMCKTCYFLYFALFFFEFALQSKIIFDAWGCVLIWTILAFQADIFKYGKLIGTLCSYTEKNWRRVNKQRFKIRR